MSDIPIEPRIEDRNTREAADLEKVREAAKAGYEGRAGMADASDAVTRREHRRAERERTAHKSHYLGTPPR